GAELGLEIGEARDDLDRDAGLARDQQDVDGAQVAGLRDRRLEEDLPRGANPSHEAGDVARLCLVANAAADRPQLDRRLQADRRGVARQGLPSEVWGATAFAARYVGL